MNLAVIFKHHPRNDVHCISKLHVSVPSREISHNCFRALLQNVCPLSTWLPDAGSQWTSHTTIEFSVNATLPLSLFYADPTFPFLKCWPKADNLREATLSGNALQLGGRV